MFSIHTIDGTFEAEENMNQVRMRSEMESFLPIVDLGYQSPSVFLLSVLSPMVSVGCILSTS